MDRVSDSEMDERIVAVEKFEARWHDRMGGDDTRDLRFMIGVALAQLTTKHEVDPRVLADYLREALRLQEPDSFDKPS